MNGRVDLTALFLHARALLLSAIKRVTIGMVSLLLIALIPAITWAEDVVIPEGAAYKCWEVEDTDPENLEALVDLFPLTNLGEVERGVTVEEAKYHCAWVDICELDRSKICLRRKVSRGVGMTCNEIDDPNETGETVIGINTQFDPEASITIDEPALLCVFEQIKDKGGLCERVDEVFCTTIKPAQCVSAKECPGGGRGSKGNRFVWRGNTRVWKVIVRRVPQVNPAGVPDWKIGCGPGLGYAW